MPYSGLPSVSKCFQDVDVPDKRLCYLQTVSHWRRAIVSILRVGRNVLDLAEMGVQSKSIVLPENCVME